jgi:hypothetical protein
MRRSRNTSPAHHRKFFAAEKAKINTEVKINTAAGIKQSRGRP